MRYKLGIDVGGTKIEGVVLSSQDVVHTKRISTNASEGYFSILHRIKALYSELVQYIENKPHTLGVGSPGSISEKLPYMKNSNIRCFNGKKLRSDLQEILCRHIAFENDANCFTLAESFMGSAINYKMVFGAVIGTGCGGGIVYEGKCYKGAGSLAGEWGHLSMNPNGPLCYCGRRGCVETYISGGGLQRMWENMYEYPLSLIEIVNACEGGDEDAVIFIEQFYKNFAQAMANLITVLDPDIIVIGGGVGNIKGIYDTGIHYVQKILNRAQASPKIVKGMVGNSACSIGAALLSIE